MRITAVFLIVGLSVAGCAGPADKRADNVENVTVCRVADTPHCAEELARAQQERAYALQDQQTPSQASSPWQDPSAGQSRLWGAPETAVTINAHGPSPLQEAVAVPVPSSPVFPRVSALPSPADGRRNSPFSQRVLDTRAAGPR